MDENDLVGLLDVIIPQVMSLKDIHVMTDEELEKYLEPIREALATVDAEKLLRLKRVDRQLQLCASIGNR